MGWYADPLDPSSERYWDGWQWSRTTRAREGGPPAAPAGPPAGSPPVPQGGPGPQPGQPPQGYPQQPGHPQQGYPGYPQQGYPGYPQQSYPGYPPPGQVQPRTGRSGQASFTADGVRLAGWWWRALAALVDGLIVTLLVAAATLPLLLPMFGRMSAYFAEAMAAAERGLPQPALDQSTLMPAGDQLLLALATVTITFVYQALFLRWRGATPGKLLCGLRVVPVDQGRTSGGLDWRRAVSRALIWAAPGLNTLLGLFQIVDVLFPLWQPRRQAVHDLVAGTQVVRP